MLENLKEIILEVKERSENPLLSAFIISWLIFNYDYILVFFSSIDTFRKITYINEHFHENYLLTYVPDRLEIPLYSAFSYILLSNIIQYMYFWFWIRGKVAVKNLKISALNNEQTSKKKETHKIKKLENDLMKLNEDLRIEFEKHMNERNKILSDNAKHTENLVNKITELKSDIDKLNDEKSELLKSNREISNNFIIESNVNIFLTKTSEELKKYNQRMIDIRNILQYLLDHNGTMKASEAKLKISNNSDAQYFNAIQQDLIDSGYVQNTKWLESDAEYIIKRSGREAMAKYHENANNLISH